MDMQAQEQDKAVWVPKINGVPWEPKVGDRVRVRLSHECPGRYWLDSGDMHIEHNNEDGAVGFIVRTDETFIGHPYYVGNVNGARHYALVEIEPWPLGD